VTAQHGNRAAYKFGCRCEDCRGANRAYLKSYRAKGSEPRHCACPRPLTLERDGVVFCARCERVVRSRVLR
jgi:hypothetical protein